MEAKDVAVPFEAVKTATKNGKFYLTLDVTKATANRRLIFRYLLKSYGARDTREEQATKIK